MDGRLNALEQKTLSVIIPLYNEEATIAALLDRVRDCPLTLRREIIVVDDGSTDGSRVIVERWLAANPDTPERSARLIVKANGGKGSAVREGLRHSTGDVVIIQDADLEYDPRDYGKCAAPIVAGECRVVYGSRALSPNALRAVSSPAFFVGGVLLTAWVNLLFGTVLTDEPTCYKCFDGPLIRALPFEGDGFDWEPEITAKLIRLGFEIREVAVRYTPRRAREGKKIRSRDGLLAFLTVLRWRFAAMGALRAELEERLPGMREHFTARCRRRKVILAVLLLALVLRLGVSLPGLLASDTRRFMRPDTPSYTGPARALAVNFRYHRDVDNPLPATARPPGYPFFLALLLGAGNGSIALVVVVSCLVSTFTCLAVYKTTRLAGGFGAAVTAALLLALSVTAIAQAPLILADTLFAFFTALQLYFFMKYYVTRHTQNLIVCFLLLGLAALTKPVGLLLAAPLAVSAFVVGRGSRVKRVLRTLGALALFCALVTPWMARNSAVGAGFRLSSNIGFSAVNLASAVISVAEKKDGGDLRRQMLQQLGEEFARHPRRYAEPQARIARMKQYFTEAVRKYPLTALYLYLRPAVLIPDAPTLLELLGVTTGGRGTLDVLNREGLAAAARHYFRGNLLPLALLVPLLLLAGAVYAAAACRTLGWLLRRNWPMLLVALTFGLFYILVHAPVPMPRYHFYALPFLCMAAGLCLADLCGALRRRRHLASAVVIPYGELVALTDVANERNIYTHPLWPARAIFWSRLIDAFDLLERHHGRQEKVLDFGGGSGVFLKALCGCFEAVDVIDLDPADARRIVQAYGLRNVRIVEADITDCRLGRTYDVITALDVLEHFRDLALPVSFIRRHLAPGGHLVVSLPTENRLYELGRRIIGKTKPGDHYHAARDVIAFLRRSGFAVRQRRLAPGVGRLRLPLFEIARLRRGGQERPAGRPGR